MSDPDSDDKVFLILLERQHDQAQEDVKRFIQNNTIESLNSLLTQYAEASNGDDDAAAIDGILAGFGLLTALIAVEKAKVAP
jgi:hypothetical protein